MKKTRRIAVKINDFDILNSILLGLYSDMSVYMNASNNEIMVIEFKERDREFNYLCGILNNIMNGKFINFNWYKES